jgi:hypothetical protein
VSDASGRPRAKETYGPLPPSADYIKAQIIARYENCNNHAKSDYTHNWETACIKIQARKQSDYEDCLARNSYRATIHNSDPAHCDSTYRTQTDCVKLPSLLATTLELELKNAQAECLREFKLGHY